MKNTTLCYIEHDGKYLLIHRNKKAHDANKDKYIGIGGHFEERESPFECAVREIREETGLFIKARLLDKSANNFGFEAVLEEENDIAAKMRYCGIVTFISDECEWEYMHLFHVLLPQKAKEDVAVCDEGDLEWIPIKEISDLPQWEGDKIFIKLMQEKHPFFSLKLVYKGNRLVSSVLAANG